MNYLVKFLIGCIALLCLVFVSCDSKEERVRCLVTEYLKSNKIAVEEFEIEQYTISSAKQTALNDSATWSLVLDWVQIIRDTDTESNKRYADPSLQESVIKTGIIISNEYVDSINHRISQLDTTKTVGHEFVLNGKITMNNNIQDLKCRVITDQDVSKILLFIPLVDESERIKKIIEGAQRGELTKIPVDPQEEIMFYFATGRHKPSF